MSSATHVGVGAKYVSISANGDKPEGLDFEKLRTVFTTGSPLTDNLFDWLDQNITNSGKSAICSISGGTDILGCFVGGNPIKPVHRGEIQSKILGMDVHAYNDKGNDVLDEKGELVCVKPFPHVPVGFRNDPGDRKFIASYFDVFPDIWTHGDLISVSSETGGIRIYGRSDTTLNPGGVRIGSAEIYRLAEAMEEIIDSIVIGIPYDNDEAICLFVVLNKGLKLDETLLAKLRDKIRTGSTPRHVPKFIFQVGETVKTLNGKKMEKSLKKLFNDEEVENMSAMENPKCLEEYKKIRDELLER